MKLHGFIYSSLKFAQKFQNRVRDDAPWNYRFYIEVFVTLTPEY